MELEVCTTPSAATRGWWPVRVNEFAPWLDEFSGRTSAALVEAVEQCR
jgi:hypothetical protein